MSYLINLLSSTFDIDFGASEEDTIASIMKTINNTDTRERDGIESDLKEIYSNPETDWISLLCNESYVAYEAKDQADGQRFVNERIWNVFFPDQKR